METAIYQQSWVVCPSNEYFNPTVCNILFYGIGLGPLVSELVGPGKNPKPINPKPSTLNLLATPNPINPSTYINDIQGTVLHAPVIGRCQSTVHVQGPTGLRPPVGLGFRV